MRNAPRPSPSTPLPIPDPGSPPQISASSPSRGVTRDPQPSLTPAPSSNSRPAPRPLPGPKSARVVACGIDTLHLFGTARLRDDLAEQLASLRDLARATPRGTPLPQVTHGRHLLTVRPFGARTAPYLLEGEHLVLRLNPRASHGLSTIAVELRSLFLWQRGPEAAVAEVEAIVAPLLAPALPAAPGAPASPLRVGRIDLTVDFQGWRPQAADLSHFIGRPKDQASYLSNSAFTGFSFGKGDLVARLYDKTTEIQKSGKSWFLPIWQASPAFAEAEPVWRLEFQLRRPALRSFRRSDNRGRLDSWADLRSTARTLWRHLLTRWLSFRMPRSAKSRQRLRPEWRALAAQGFTGRLWKGSHADLYRIARENTRARTTAQLAGYLAREYADLAFLDGGRTSLQEALPAVIRRALAHAERSGRPIEARGQELAAQWLADDRAALPSADG